MYENWKKEPSSVHSSWGAYFTNVDAGAENAYEPPPTLGKTKKHGGSGAALDESSL
jgi:2-oxoglutarate dehydrogenase E1 component